VSNEGRGNGSSSRLDLKSVRDTLLYIEDDLRASEQHARLCAILRLALNEIGETESSADEGSVEHSAALFIPMRN
jgi:hypothetical protein